MTEEVRAHGHECPECQLDFDCTGQECKDIFYSSCEPCIESEEFDVSS